MHAMRASERCGRLVLRLRPGTGAADRASTGAGIPIKASRRYATETTHGVTGRIVWTVVAIGFPVLLFWLDGPLLGAPIVVIYVATLLRWGLRDIWRRSRCGTVPWMPPQQ